MKYESYMDESYIRCEKFLSESEKEQIKKDCFIRKEIEQRNANINAYCSDDLF